MAHQQQKQWLWLTALLCCVVSCFAGCGKSKTCPFVSFTSMDGTAGVGLGTYTKMSMNYNNMPMYALYPSEGGEDTIYLYFVAETVEGGGMWVVSKSNKGGGSEQFLDATLYRVKASQEGMCQPYLEQSTPWNARHEGAYVEDILIESKCLMSAPLAPKKPLPTPKIKTTAPSPAPKPVSLFKRTVAGKLVLPHPQHLGCFKVTAADLKAAYNPRHGASPKQCCKACQIQNLWDPAAKYNSALMVNMKECYCVHWANTTLTSKRTKSVYCSQSCVGGAGLLTPTCGGKAKHADLLWIVNKKPPLKKVMLLRSKKTGPPTAAPVPTPIGQMPAIFGKIPTPVPYGNSEDDDNDNSNGVPTVAYSDRQFWDLYHLQHSNSTKYKNAASLRDRWRIEHSDDWTKLLQAKIKNPHMHLPVAPDLPPSKNHPFWKLWNAQKSPAPTPHTNRVSQSGEQTPTSVDTRDDDDKLSADTHIQKLPVTDDDDKY